MENRRCFIKKSIVLTSGAFAGSSLLSSCITYKYAVFSVIDNFIIVKSEQFLDEDEFLIVDYPSLKAPIFLHRKRDKEYEANLMLCTHKGCDVKPAGTILVCPCHGSEFARNGSVLRGPADKPLQNFAVSITGQEIKIMIP